MLVEGKADKLAVDALLSHLIGVTTHQQGLPTVDSTLILNSDPIRGARELVEHVHSLAAHDGLALRALVDRESRSVDLVARVDELEGAHHHVGAHLYWTRGHSVENYFLDISVIQAAIRCCQPELTLGAAFAMLPSVHKTLLAGCFAAGRTAQEHHVVKRMTGWCNESMWSFTTPGAVALNVGTFRNQLLATNLSEPLADAFAADLSTTFAEIQVDLQPEVTDFLRWFAHGHIAWSVMWSGVFAHYRSFGVPATELSYMGCGWRDPRFRIALSKWASGFTTDSTDHPSAFTISILQ